MGRGNGLNGVQPAIRDILVPQSGVASNGATVKTELGPSGIHRTVINVVNVNIGKPVAAADLAFGKQVFAFPAGAVIVKSAYMSLALTNTDGVIDADTPDLGLGTVVASGAVAVLSGTATFENILTGQTAANVTGTATVKTVANQILVIETAAAHTVFINAADGWAGAEATGVIANGTIILEWVAMS